MSGPNKSDRETLGKCLRFRQFWAELFGWLVGVGLLVEYWDEIVDCLINRYWPSRGLAGGLLVTVGVLGEVLLSRLALITSDKLQERADSDVAAANDRAAQAFERAVKAEERIAELNLLAEQEKQARLRFEEYAAIRDMTPEERKALSERLSEFSGQRAEIVVFPITTDTTHLAGTIFHVLEGARWNVSPAQHLSSSPTEYVKSGVHIETTPDEFSIRAAWNLLLALHSSGSSSSSLPDPSYPRMRILVGDKPAAWSSMFRRGKPYGSV